MGSYHKIMVPVDLAHLDSLDKALRTAADLAAGYRIPVCYVSVAPGAAPLTAAQADEFREALDTFALDQAERHGFEATARAVIPEDDSLDVREALMRALEESGADLVVMASHIPDVDDRMFASNAAYVASSAPITVMVVR
ncbi:universal stress protein [Lentisalinibacter salinarum]|uniref:universal stress protein n=1 Tax=Lentisalinibacter salinarum TaxID=2992239 RepID=UPI00386E3B8D